MGAMMISRAYKAGALLVFSLSLGSCEWKAAAPLLPVSGAAAPEIAGDYTMALDGLPESARIVRKQGKEFRFLDAENREMAFTLSPLDSPREGTDLYLVQTTEKPGEYRYFIASIERGIIRVFLPLCKPTAARPGMDVNCNFTSGEALRAAGQDIAAEMQTTRYQSSGFIVLRPKGK